LRAAWFALHGLPLSGLCSRVNELASAMPRRRVLSERWSLDVCDVSTIVCRLFQSGLQLVPRINNAGDGLTGKTTLARRLRVNARRASGTLGSFSPPMNRVRYTPAHLLHSPVCIATHAGVARSAADRRSGGHAVQTKPVRSRRCLRHAEHCRTWSYNAPRSTYSI
jgi:hypothetical protein